jgi:hypothetical protein
VRRGFWLTQLDTGGDYEGEYVDCGSDKEGNGAVFFVFDFKLFDLTIAKNA